MAQRRTVAVITLEQANMLINTAIAATSIWLAYKKSDASRRFKKKLSWTTHFKKKPCNVSCDTFASFATSDGGQHDCICQA